MKTTKSIRAATESLQQAAYELTAHHDAQAARLKATVLRLHALGHVDHTSKIREQYESTASKLCLARWQELPSTDEDNPLDDYEKLRQVRIAVFGSAPESSYLTPQTR